MISMTPKRIGAVITAYTGVSCGDNSEFLLYAQEKLGHEITPEEIRSINFAVRLKAAAKDDFQKLHRWCGGNEHDTI